MHIELCILKRLKKYNTNQAIYFFCILSYFFHSVLVRNKAILSLNSHEGYHDLKPCTTEAVLDWGQYSKAFTSVIYKFSHCYRV